MCYFVVNSLSPQRSPSNSMTTILNFKNPAALFKQPIKRKTGSVETLIDILPSVHRKSRSKKHSKLGVDTSYLRRLIEQQEEDQNKRFKQPGDVSNINIMNTADVRGALYHLVVMIKKAITFFWYSKPGRKSGRNQHY